MIEVEPAMDEAMAAAVQSKSCLAQLDGEIEVNLDQEYSWDIILINDDSEESIEIEAQFNDTLFTGLGPGSYTLIATSHCGNDVSVGNLDVAHPQSVEAEFYLENIMVNLNNNESAVFLNMSSNANSFAWDFGDGTIDSLVVDPVHFYEEAGDYLVTLTSWNIHCSHSTQQGVMVVAQDPTDEQPEDAHSLHEMDWGDVIITSFKPNAVVVYSTKAINAEIILSIFNATGQLVVEQHADRLTGTPIEVKTAQLAQGVFYFHINSRETVLYSEKFMKN
jgi:PKD repeat protein